MFEQSTIDIQTRRWTAMLSLTLQSALVGAGILFSVWTVDVLPSLELAMPSPPLPRAPRPVEIVAIESSAENPSANSASLWTPTRAFQEPIRIPRGIDMTPETAGAAPQLPVLETAGHLGVAGSLVGDGHNFSIALGVNTGFTAPPAPSSPQTSNKLSDPPKMVRISGGVLASKLVRRIVPEYPALARNMRVSGTVKLSAIIARDGTVRDLRLLSGHPLLAQAALTAVREWLYTPTLLNGEPVEVAAPIEVHFTLGSH